jgi:fumarate reductase subunit C
MARAAHPDAMAPPQPGSTRTAPPQMPDEYPMSGRYRAYTLFDATGIVYMVLGLLILDVVWALGSGQAEWAATLASFQNPAYIAFHAFSLVCVIFVGVRFFRLFPKAQPPQIGPLKPPPQPVIAGMLYAVWIGVTVVLAAILAGGLF